MQPLKLLMLKNSVTQCRGFLCSRPASLSFTVDIRVPWFIGSAISEEHKYRRWIGTTDGARRQLQAQGLTNRPGIDGGDTGKKMSAGGTRNLLHAGDGL